MTENVYSSVEFEDLLPFICKTNNFAENDYLQKITMMLAQRKSVGQIATHVFTNPSLICQLLKEKNIPTPQDISRMEKVFAEYKRGFTDIDSIYSHTRVNKELLSNAVNKIDEAFNEYLAQQMQTTNGKVSRAGYTTSRGYINENSRTAKSRKIQDLKKILKMKSREVINGKTPDEHKTREAFMNNLSEFTDKDSEYRKEYGTGFELDHGILDTAIGMLGKSPELVKRPNIRIILLNAYRAYGIDGLVREGRSLAATIDGMKHANDGETSLNDYKAAIDTIVSEFSNNYIELVNISDNTLGQHVPGIDLRETEFSGNTSEQETTSKTKRRTRRTRGTRGIAKDTYKDR